MILRREAILTPTVAMICLLVAAGCQSSKHIDTAYVPVTIQDPVPEYDALFTWTHYQYQEDFDKSKVIYYWNGELAGEGPKGFQAVLNNMAELPKRSRVLTYPLLPYDFSIWPSQPTHDYPFIDEYDQLEDRVEASGIILYWSHKNHLGQILGPFGVDDLPPEN